MAQSLDDLLDDAGTADAASGVGGKPAKRGMSQEHKDAMAAGRAARKAAKAAPQAPAEAGGVVNDPPGDGVQDDGLEPHASFPAVAEPKLTPEHEHYLHMLGMKHGGPLPEKVQLTSPHGFIDDFGRHNHWNAGDVIGDPNTVRLLIDRRAPVKVVP